MTVKGDGETVCAFLMQELAGRVYERCCVCLGGVGPKASQRFHNVVDGWLTLCKIWEDLVDARRTQTLLLRVLWVWAQEASFWWGFSLLGQSGRNRCGCASSAEVRCLTLGANIMMLFVCDCGVA